MVLWHPTPAFAGARVLVRPRSRTISRSPPRLHSEEHCARLALGSGIERPWFRRRRRRLRRGRAVQGWAGIERVGSTVRGTPCGRNHVRRIAELGSTGSHAREGGACVRRQVDRPRTAVAGTGEEDANGVRVTAHQESCIQLHWMMACAQRAGHPGKAGPQEEGNSGRVTSRPRAGARRRHAAEGSGSRRSVFTMCLGRRARWGRPVPARVGRRRCGSAASRTVR